MEDDDEFEGNRNLEMIVSKGNAYVDVSANITANEADHAKILSIFQKFEAALNSEDVNASAGHIKMICNYNSGLTHFSNETKIFLQENKFIAMIEKLIENQTNDFFISLLPSISHLTSIPEFANLISQSFIFNHSFDILNEFHGYTNQDIKVVLDFIASISNIENLSELIYEKGILNFIQQVNEGDVSIELIEIVTAFFPKYFPNLCKKEMPMMKSLEIFRLFGSMLDRSLQIDAELTKIIQQNLVFNFLQCCGNNSISKLILTIGISYKLAENLEIFNTRAKLFAIQILCRNFQDNVLTSYLGVLASKINIDLLNNLLENGDELMKNNVLILFSYLFKYIEDLADHEAGENAFTNVKNLYMTLTADSKKIAIDCLISGFQYSKIKESKKLWFMNDLFVEGVENICLDYLDDEINEEYRDFIQEIFDICDKGSDMYQAIYPYVERGIIREKTGPHHKFNVD